VPEVVLTAECRYEHRDTSNVIVVVVAAAAEVGNSLTGVAVVDSMAVTPHVMETLIKVINK
jgi:hypothetical protein